MSISLFFFRSLPYNGVVLGADNFKRKGRFPSMEEATTKKKKHCYTCYIDGEAFLCCDGEENTKPKKKKCSKKKEN